MTALPSSEHHPLDFFLPTPTKLLMLGSFPPPTNRRSMHFYYPNFQNDMRRILGLIFYHDTTFFIAPNGKSFDETKAKAFCEEKGIGIGDTAKEVLRLQGNASDDTLQVIQAFDIEALLATLPYCHTLVLTGQKAMDTLLSQLFFTKPKL
jgi:G:T/U-mismatch repair DNA glycosylase